SPAAIGATSVPRRRPTWARWWSTWVVAAPGWRRYGARGAADAGGGTGARGSSLGACLLAWRAAGRSGIGLGRRQLGRVGGDQGVLGPAGDDPEGHPVCPGRQQALALTGAEEEGPLALGEPEGLGQGIDA